MLTSDILLVLGLKILLPIGCLNVRWKNRVHKPAEGRRMQIFHLIFTQPMGSNIFRPSRFSRVPKLFTVQGSRVKSKKYKCGRKNIVLILSCDMWPLLSDCPQTAHFLVVWIVHYTGTIKEPALRLVSRCMHFVGQLENLITCKSCIKSWWHGAYHARSQYITPFCAWAKHAWTLPAPGCLCLLVRVPRNLITPCWGSTLLLASSSSYRITNQVWRREH